MSDENVQPGSDEMNVEVPDSASVPEAQDVVAETPVPEAPAAPIATKSKVAAGILAILLGSLGVHKFYLGYNKEGVIMLLVSVLSFGLLAGVVGIVALVEGVLYLVMSDEDFNATYVMNKKAWF